MEEVWGEVPDFKGLYEASTLGRIRSLDRNVTGKNGVTKRFSGRVLAPVPMKTGYHTVSLSKDGVAVRYLVHRLVALSFIPNPDGLEEVNHKDGVKHHNALSNLEWMSRVRNIRHAMGMGLIQGVGEQNPAAKLTEKQVVQIKQLSRLYLSPREIASAFGVKPSTITDIQLCRSWAHVHVGGSWSEIRKERGGVVTRLTVEVLDRPKIDCATMAHK